MAKKKKESVSVGAVFDLGVGDRVRHGRNIGTVTAIYPERGPTIEWDHGLIDYIYTEEMHSVHSLHKVIAG